MREDFLFSDVEWFHVEENQKKKLSEEIANIDGNRLLNTSIDDLCDYFEKKYRIDVPVLIRDEIVVDQHETQIDISQDFSRVIRNRRRPFLSPGTTIEISVPFRGEAEAFRIQPSTSSVNPPRGEVQSPLGLLILHIEGTNLQADQVRREIDNTLSEIETNLTRLRTDVQGLNAQLLSLARGAIERRRQKLLADHSLVSSLGFKIKERPDAARTYITPEVRRKISPSLPPASSAPYKAEPVLSTSDYEHILGVIQNMTYVIERSPSAFASMKEEFLRFHFLVQLNGHYEGQATGETFNYEGKTDILIRSEGKNIFIAECKYWGGPKKLIDTLNQILGYSSWRDTKVGVIIFNQNKDFSKVLQAIWETVKSHPNFKRDLGPRSETSFRYVFAHRDDPNREMLLTVLVFDVPS